jgi:hypothetical protein
VRGIPDERGLVGAVAQHGEVPGLVLGNASAEPGAGGDRAGIAGLIQAR